MQYSTDDEPTILRIGALRLNEALEGKFYCQIKFRRVALGQCLDDYVTHSAYNISTSDCAHCPQGQQNRQRFAES